SRSVLVDRLRARARAGPCRALATALGRDGRIPQPSLVTTIDHPVDLRAIDADIAQRAVVERAQLARRRLALAAQRIGTPPFACGRRDSRGEVDDAGHSPGDDGLQGVHDGAGELAQRAGAGGVRAAEDLLPRPLPLLRR